MKEDVYKIILTGDSGVGKTSLVWQFVENKLPESDCTIGGQHFRKELALEDRNIKMEIWDTAGQERFKSLVRMFYRETNGCICMFDVSNRISFDNLIFWIGDYTTNNLNINKKILVVANKCDIDVSKWEVTQDEIKILCDKYDCPHIFTSCTKKKNVDEVFLKLFDLIISSEPAIEQFQIETGKINIRKVNPIEEPVLCSC